MRRRKAGVLGLLVLLTKNLSMDDKRKEILRNQAADTLGDVEIRQH